MRDIDRLREQMERAWNGPAWHGPSLRETLDGVTAAAAFARPVAVAHRIVEIVLHVATWERAAARRASGTMVSPTDAEDWPQPATDGEDGWARALATLGTAHAELSTVLSMLDDDSLDRSAAGQSYTIGLMLHGVVQHDLYHAGQIALLRKVTG